MIYNNKKILFLIKLYILYNKIFNNNNNISVVDTNNITTKESHNITTKESHNITTKESDNITTKESHNITTKESDNITIIHNYIIETIFISTLCFLLLVILFDYINKLLKRKKLNQEYEEYEQIFDLIQAQISNQGDLDNTNEYQSLTLRDADKKTKYKTIKDLLLKEGKNYTEISQNNILTIMVFEGEEWDNFDKLLAAVQKETIEKYKNMFENQEEDYKNNLKDYYWIKVPQNNDDKKYGCFSVPRQNFTQRYISEKTFKLLEDYTIFINEE
jgi:hypothetical protein